MKLVHVALGAALLVSTAYARMDFSAGQTLRIDPPDTVRANFFGAAQKVFIAGAVEGDVCLAAQWIDITGNVAGDAWAGAAEVAVTGTVAGDVRAACGKAHVSGSVAGDVLLLCGAAFVEKSASVGGDIVILSGSAKLDGAVGGRLTIEADTAYVNGTVTGGATIDARQVVIGPDARITGALLYSSPNEASIDPGAVVGGVKRVPWERDKPGPFSGVLASIIFTLMTFASGLAAVLLFPKASALTSTVLGTRPLASLGMGVLAIVLLPVVFLVLLITVVGIPLALVWLGVYAVAALMTRVTASLFVGRLILVRSPSWDGAPAGPLVASLALGLLVLTVLDFIPVLDSIVSIVVLLVGLGAIAIAVVKGMKKARASAGAPIAA